MMSTAGNFFAICIVVVLTGFSGSLAQDSAGDVEARGETVSSAIPFKQEFEPSGHALLKISLALSLSLAIILLIVFLFKKNMMARLRLPVSHRIELCAVKRLTSKLTVFLIKVDGQEYLVLQTGEAVQLCKHNSSHGESDSA